MRPNNKESNSKTFAKETERGERWRENKPKAWQNTSPAAKLVGCAISTSGLLTNKTKPRKQGETEREVLLIAGINFKDKIKITPYDIINNLWPKLQIT